MTCKASLDGDTPPPLPQRYAMDRQYGMDISMFLANPVQNIPDQLQEHFPLILGMQLKLSHASCINKIKEKYIFKERLKTLGIWVAFRGIDKVVLISFKGSGSDVINMLTSCMFKPLPLAIQAITSLAV